jgi:hypothetical protein
LKEHVDFLISELKNKDKHERSNGSGGNGIVSPGNEKIGQQKGGHPEGQKPTRPNTLDTSSKIGNRRFNALNCPTRVLLSDRKPCAYLAEELVAG